VKFKKGDRVYWRDGVVGEASGTVTSAWIDSRIGEVLYVARDGGNDRYPVDVIGDRASKRPHAARVRVDAGPKTM
jgi:hypothetical protein